MILMIGDSLSVGTPLAAVMPNHRVVVRAEVGVGTSEGVRRFLHPVTGQAVVVSLGTNDGNAQQVKRELPQIKRATRGRCLLWVQVAGVPWAGAVNATVRNAGVKMIPWHSRAVHPSPAGYKMRARRIARYVRACTS